jgi:predicted Zn-dependent protease with MMP-like domain
MILFMHLAQATSGLFPEISDENKFWLFMLVLALFFGGFWLMNRNAKKWLEANGREDVLQNDLKWLLDESAEAAKAPALIYSEQEFKGMVAKALDEIPEEFEKEWENVAVTVSAGWPTDAEKKRMGVAENYLLFGKYSGASHVRGWSARKSAQNVITIYQPALELRYGSDKVELEQEVRRVVLHELAHHLGMTHEKMKEIGL